MMLRNLCTRRLSLSIFVRLGILLLLLAVTLPITPTTPTLAQGSGPGTGGVITITGQLSSTLPTGHIFTNAATITGTVADTTPGNNSSSVKTTISSPDLVVTKTVSPEPAIAGRSLAYTVTVVNQGTDTAYGVVLSDTLPPSTTLHYVDQTDSDGGLYGFGGGTGENITWHDPRPAVPEDDWLELANPISSSGVFTSRVMDAFNIVDWESLAWHPRRPYWKDLPDDGQAETAYALGNVDMMGDQVLLHLDESAGPTFADASGLGHDGACPAAPGETCPTAGAEGRFNGALSFDGALSQTVAITDPLDPARYALELWVRPAAVSDTSLILRTDAISGTAAQYSHLLGISGGRFLHLVHDGTFRAVTGTTTVVTGTWYHVVGTAQSGGDIKLYVNGEEEARLGGIGTLWTGGDQYRLGSAYGPAGTAYFSGELDEVAVYSRTLSTAEITDHYLRGALRLSFQARACDDGACDGETFVGPGGLTTTVHSELSNTSLADPPSVTLTGTQGYRYFQYQATLETDDADYSPQLQSVSVGPAHRAVSATQGSCLAPAAHVFTCTLGSLAGGGAITITTRADIHPSALGVITNTATVTTTSLDLNPVNNTAVATSTVEALADLVVLKHDEDWEGDLELTDTGGADPVSPGETLTYTLRVRNAGPSTARSITVSDQLPGGLVGYPSGDPGWACSAPGNTITCTLGSLLPTYSWRELYDWEHIIVTATAPLVGGFITNTVWVTTTTPEVDASDNVTTEMTLITPLADLEIAKSAAPEPVDPGATLVYTVTVTNRGPYTATNVIVTDTLPAGLTGYPDGGGDWACSPPGDEVVCALSHALTPTLSASFNLTVTAPLSGFLANYAHVTSDIRDPEPENDYAAAYTSIRPVADLSIGKRDTPDPVDAGAPLTYTITITNAGPVPAGALTTTLAAGNGIPMRIPWLEGSATPYRTSIYLSNVPGLIRNVTVTLRGLSHSYPGDLSILLVGPGGRGVMLLGNAGGGSEVNDVTLTFNDAGAPASEPLTSTTVYRPTNDGLSEDLPDPAPSGPYGGSLSDFNGSSPDGVWRLYVYDNVYSDGGEIAAGWSLQVTAVTTDMVTVTDTLPASLSGASVAAPSGWVCGAGGSPLACTGNRLAVDVPTVLTVNATAPLVAPSTGSGQGVIVNAASITSTVYDPHGLDNSVVITTTVVPSFTVRIYLPLVMRNYVSAPDLVVDDIIATANNVQVVISNQGDRPVEDEFWVDVYIDPDPAPSAVNQIWEDLADQGLVWGVTEDALPLQPGDVLTLTVGGDYYRADHSEITWPLAADTPVWAQADSANSDTTYGGVLENHEITGGDYNNISSTVSTLDPARERLFGILDHWIASLDRLLRGQVPGTCQVPGT